MAAEPRPFTYAILQVVPCLERGERINVGVVLYCRQIENYLGSVIGLNREKLEVIKPDVDYEEIAEQLDEIASVIRGDDSAGALARMDPSDRFGWVVAPSSTVIQSSPVHTGLTSEPKAEIDRLFEKLVS